MTEAFDLDPRLAAETVLVTRWPVCRVLLQDDARFAWLILVPQRAGLSELYELEPDDRMQLTREIDAAARALKEETGALKINVGALGNIVRQLHVHVIARREGDAAWPGPVWGKGTREPMEITARASLLARMQARLARAFS